VCDTAAITLPGIVYNSKSDDTDDVAGDNGCNITMMIIMIMMMMAIIMRLFSCRWQNAREQKARALSGTNAHSSYTCAEWLYPLDYKGNYSATSNNTKLVHWPLMGGLLHLVQRERAWAGCGPAQAPPSTHKRPVYQSLYCCIVLPLLCSFNMAIKGLNNLYIGLRKMRCTCEMMRFGCVTVIEIGTKWKVRFRISE